MKPNRERYRGFTLIEMAIVLLVIGLLLGGLLTPLASKVESGRYKETNRELEKAVDALMGYAVVNQRLPCADLDEPDEVGHGFADAAGCGTEGYLPWADLGVGKRDAWGHPLRYRVDPAFSATIPDPPDTTDPGYSVVDRAGAPLTPGYPDGPLVIIFSCGNDGLPNGANEDTSVDAATCKNLGTQDTIYVQDVRDANFDDLLIWLSKNRLLNRMVKADKWP